MRSRRGRRGRRGRGLGRAEAAAATRDPVRATLARKRSVCDAWIHGQGPLYSGEVDVTVNEDATGGRPMPEDATGGRPMPPPPAPARPAADSWPAPAAGGQQPQRPAPAPEHSRGPPPLKAHVGVPPGAGGSFARVSSGVHECVGPENGTGNSSAADFTTNFDSNTVRKACFCLNARRVQCGHASPVEVFEWFSSHF